MWHGVGLCAETPTTWWRSQSGHYAAVIEAGKVISHERFLGHEKAAEGVKLEDQVLVTETGIEVMSSLPFEDDWL